MKTSCEASPWLLVRADGSTTIGAGHIMRCLALAHAWQDAGGRVIFAAADIPDTIINRLRDDSVSFHQIPGPPGGALDLKHTLELAGEIEAQWVAVDGYAFDHDYLAALKPSRAKILVIDDMAHQSRYTADLLLNQNLSASVTPYRGKVAPNTALLLGPKFSLLRREFRTCDFGKRQPGASLRVLVTFGGGDAENFTAHVLRNLNQTSGRFEVVALAGAANTHVDELRTLAQRLRFPCEVQHNLANVVPAMHWADVAITAGGSTVWELACAGLPSLIAVHEDNQLSGADALRAVPFFRVCHASELTDRNLGADLDFLASQTGSQGWCDALGAERVVNEMLSKTDLKTELCSR